MIPEGADRHAASEDGGRGTRDGRALARLRAELREIQLLLDGLRGRLGDVRETRADRDPGDAEDGERGSPDR